MTKAHDTQKHVVDAKVDIGREVLDAVRHYFAPVTIVLSMLRGSRTRKVAVPVLRRERKYQIAHDIRHDSAEEHRAHQD